MSEKHYIFWEKNPVGEYRDDVGFRYTVSVLSEDQYLKLPNSERLKYRTHWADDRFIELAGLAEVKQEENEMETNCSIFRGEIKKTATEIAVILTVWKRTERLIETIRQIKTQTFKDFDVYVINNNTQSRREVDEIVRNSGINIRVFQMDFNMAFVARHLLAKKLAKNGYPYIIMLDDDLDIKPEAFSVLNAEKKPKTIKSILALNFKNFFYDQQEEKEAKPSKYVGPGGMICDSSLFTIPEFWGEWGIEYYIIDDFWISYFARKRGWDCGKSLAPMTLRTGGNEEVKTYKKNAVMLLRNDFIEKYTWTSSISSNSAPELTKTEVPVFHKKSIREILANRQKLSDVILRRKISDIFSPKKKSIILEVGACECEDSVKYARWFPNAKVFAFEPIKKNQEIGQKRIRDGNLASRIELIPCACGDVKGETEINVSSGRPDSAESDDETDYGNKSSSLLKPKKHREVHPWCKFETIQKTEVIRMDDFCESRKITEIDFLHLDVQGFEKNVLIGMGKMLQKTSVIYLEVESVELYEGQPLKKDIESFLTQNGFIKLHDTVGTVSGDQIWKKKGDPVIFNPRAAQWR